MWSRCRWAGKVSSSRSCMPIYIHTICTHCHCSTNDCASVLVLSLPLYHSPHRITMAINATASSSRYCFAARLSAPATSPLRRSRVVSHAKVRSLSVFSDGQGGPAALLLSRSSTPSCVCLLDQFGSSVAHARASSTSEAVQHNRIRGMSQNVRDYHIRLHEEDWAHSSRTA